MSKKTKLPTVTFVTPFGELRWPKITNPDTEGKFADGKFKSYSIYGEDDHKTVESRLREAAESPAFQAYFKSQGVDLDGDAILQLPIKEFKNRDTGEVEELGFNFKSKYRPAVFDVKKKKLPITAKIGNGTEARTEAVIFPWAKTEKVKVKDAKTGKVTESKEVGYGVSMRFASLQIRKLVEGGGASDGSAFDDDVEGFEYDASDQDGGGEGDQFDL